MHSMLFLPLGWETEVRTYIKQIESYCYTYMYMWTLKLYQLTCIPFQSQTGQWLSGGLLVYRRQFWELPGYFLVMGHGHLCKPFLFCARCWRPPSPSAVAGNKISLLYFTYRDIYSRHNWLAAPCNAGRKPAAAKEQSYANYADHPGCDSSDPILDHLTTLFHLVMQRRVRRKYGQWCYSYDDDTLLQKAVILKKATVYSSP